MGTHISSFSAATFGLIAYPLIFAHVLALIWFVWRRWEIAPLLGANLLVSGGVLVYWRHVLTRCSTTLIPIGCSLHSK